MANKLKKGFKGFKGGHEVEAFYKRQNSCVFPVLDENGDFTRILSEAEGGLVRPKQHAWTIQKQIKYNAPIETIELIQYYASGGDPYKYRILNQCEECGQQFFLSPYSIFNNGSSNKNFRYRKETGCTFRGCDHMKKKPKDKWDQFRTSDPHENAKRMEENLRTCGTNFRCLDPENATHTHKIKLNWKCLVCELKTTTEFYGLSPVGDHQHGCAGCRGSKYTSKTLKEELKSKREDVLVVADSLQIAEETGGVRMDERAEWECQDCNLTFSATPRGILQGKQCDHCGNSSESREAREMKKYVSKKTGKEIHEIAEKKGLLRNVAGTAWLRPDIYCERGKRHLWVEVHGRQHYEPVSHFGGEDAHEDLERRDRQKEEHCRNNRKNYLAISQEYVKGKRQKWEKILDHALKLSDNGTYFHCHIRDEESEKGFF